MNDVWMTTHTAHFDDIRKKKRNFNGCAAFSDNIAFLYTVPHRIKQTDFTSHENTVAPAYFTARGIIQDSLGNEYLDILALDVYGSDFNQAYYDSLMALSEGKPLTLGEVDNPPTPEVLEKQPNWVYWVIWSGMVRGTAQADFDKLAGDPRVVFMEDPAYLEGTRAYRQASGFAPLTVDRSSDMVSTGFNNSERIQNANWSAEKDTLTIDSKTSLTFGGRPVEIQSQDVWTLKRRGKQLVIYQKAQSFRGPRESTLVYDKQ